MIDSIKKLLTGNNNRETINNVLIYSHFEDGLLFLNDGTIVKAFEFKGSQIESNDKNYYETLNIQLSNALSLLPINTTIHKVDLKVAKVYNEKAEKSDILQTDINDHFSGRTGLDHKCYIFMILGKEPILNPLLTGLSKFNLNVSAAKKIDTSNIKAFENSCNSFSAAIQSIGFKIKAVDDINKLYTVINNCLNLKLEKADRSYCIIEGDIVKSKNYINIGQNLCTYITMVSQPDKLLPTSLNENGITVSYTNPLYNLPFPHIIHTTFQKLKRDEKLKQIDNEKFLNLSMFSGKENNIKTEGTQIRFKQIQRDTIKIREENLSLYNVSIAVGVLAKNEKKLNERVNDCINAYHYLGIEPLQETVDNLNIFWSYMPGNGGNVYRTLCTTCRCAAVYFNTDTYKDYANEGINFIDRNMYPVKFKFVSDVTDNPHALFIGSTGSGKTFTMNHLVNSRVQQGSRIVLLDNKGDYEEIVKSLGGTHINYSENDPIKFNPFLIGSEKSNDRVEFLTQFIASIAGFDTENKILYAVILTRVNDYLDIENDTATLTKFYEWNNTKAKHIDNFPESDFRVALELYATGPYSHLFNHTEIDDITDIKLLSIDFKPINNAKYFKQVFMIVNEICKQIVKKYPYQLKYIIMDECWKQLADNPKFINYYMRVGRSLNVSLNLVTQGASEILDNSIGDTIISSCDTVVLFSHAGKSKIQKQLGKAFSLTQHEMDLFKSLTSGKKPTYREIFIKQKNKSLVLGVEVPLNLIGLYTTVAEEVSAFKILKKLNDGVLRKAQIDFAKLIKEKANFKMIYKLQEKGLNPLKEFKADKPIISAINNGDYDYMLTESENSKGVLV